MKNLIDQRLKRQRRVRAKLFAASDLPRLVVVRSNKNIFAQLLDRQSGKVICALSTQNLHDFKGTKTAAASKVGEELGETIKKNKISNIVLDRGYYRFHGRVKALADGIRKVGINL